MFAINTALQSQHSRKQEVALRALGAMFDTSGVFHFIKDVDGVEDAERREKIITL
jgi:hypothetical protein